MICRKSTRAADYALASEVVKSAEFAALPAAVQKEIRNHRSGLWGEKDTAFILDREFGGADNDRHAVIHNLRLPDGNGGFAQFDHIVLSRYSRTAAIFESKNYAGKISKNAQDEWHVWYEGQRRPVDIPNPVSQVRRQRIVLEAWLRAKGHTKAFEAIAVFVIVPPTARIDRKAIPGDERIFKSDNLVAAWTPFGGTTRLSRLFSAGVSGMHMLGIARQLIADHVPEPNIYARLGIDAGEEEEAVVEGETQSAAAPEPVPMQEPEGGDADDEPLPDTGPQAHVVPAPDTQAIETIEPITLPAPEEASPATKRGRKASAPLPVCAGITERTLPDRRIAFRASPDDAIGKEALSSLCKGKAVWNPMFSTWLCLPDIAGEIRAGLPDAIREVQMP